MLALSIFVVFDVVVAVFGCLLWLRVGLLCLVRFFVSFDVVFDVVGLFPLCSMLCLLCLVGVCCV